jgi:hypothetical protein
MRDDSEFSEFAEAAVTRLRQTAFLLSRDWHFAQDLTQITLSKVYLKWRRIDDPHAYAKKILLRAFLDHKRRCSSDEFAVADLLGLSESNVKIQSMRSLAILTSSMNSMLTTSRQA